MEISVLKYCWWFRNPAKQLFIYHDLQRFYTSQVIFSPDFLHHQQCDMFFAKEKPCRFRFWQKNKPTLSWKTPRFSPLLWGSRNWTATCTGLNWRSLHGCITSRWWLRSLGCSLEQLGGRSPPASRWAHLPIINAVIVIYVCVCIYT